MIKKPMLASKVDDLSDIQFPVIATPKIDGIRCLKVDGDIVSRTLKRIRNEYIRSVLEMMLPEGADGEVLVGDSFRETSSGVMKATGEPDFSYCMFDLVTDPNQPYIDRLQEMEAWCERSRLVIPNLDEFIQILPHTWISNSAQLIAYEEQCIEAGFEGVMIRTPSSPYKFGRSTVRQGWLLKIKRFTDSEAEVIGFEEAHHNLNVATTDALGYTKRSTAKDGKTPAGWLGNIHVRDLKSKVEFGIGGGWTLEQRKEIWANRFEYLGCIAKYRYQPHGTEDRPRFPQFLGWRDKDDL